MSFFSSPPSVSPAAPPVPDPEQVAARKGAQQVANAEQISIAERERQRQLGRTLGTRGANSTYSDTAAGFSRPMGTANI